MTICIHLWNDIASEMYSSFWDKWEAWETEESQNGGQEKRWKPGQKIGQKFDKKAKAARKKKRNAECRKWTG